MYCYRLLLDILATPSNETNGKQPTDRVHSLLFDITELDLTESIDHADLRLYTLIKRDQRSYYGVSRVVSVYEIIEFKGSDGRKLTKHNFISSKFVHHMENEWESFDVTAAVKRSVQQQTRIERLEIRIRNSVTRHTNDMLDFTAVSNDQKQPLLVVYSNDEDHAHQKKKEAQELYMHELALAQGSDVDDTHSDQDDYDEPNDVLNLNGLSFNHSRRKRSKRARKHDCKRQPLYINFAAINLHDSIIAPQGYQVCI